MVCMIEMKWFHGGNFVMATRNAWRGMQCDGWCAYHPHLHGVRGGGSVGGEHLHIYMCIHAHFTSKGFVGCEKRHHMPFRA